MAIRLVLATTVLLACGIVHADEGTEQRRQALLSQMRSLAEETKVQFAGGGQKPQFVMNPVFRYDDQPRRFIDATMWAWTDAGRPVAFQKIEAMADSGGGAHWGYCFTSLADEPLQAEWAGGRKYRSTEAGMVYERLTDAPPTSDRGADRRRQTRELARRFTARIVNDPRTNRSEQMRLLTTPIFEFDDQKTKLLEGAVFGFATHGTNPDLLIALAAREAEGKPVWCYAAARMTTGGVTVKYQEKVVWTCPFVEPGGGKFPTWTFFATRRVPVDGEEQQ